MADTVSSMQMLKKGDIINGVVKSIMPCGVLVRVENSSACGILYTEDISNIKIKDPSEKLKKGDFITLMVKRCDKYTGKLVFTSQAQCNFEEMTNDLNANDILIGTIKNRYKNGVFVEIKPNLVGFADYKAGLSYGDKVNVSVKKISQKDQRIKLEILA